jgi:hypothetical protein
MNLPSPLRLRLRELQRFSVHTAEIEALNQVTELIHAAREYYFTAPCDCASTGCGAEDCYGKRHDSASLRLIAALTPFEETAA